MNYDYDKVVDKVTMASTTEEGRKKEKKGPRDVIDISWVSLISMLARAVASAKVHIT